MKCRCQDCAYYYEGNDGDYGGGPFYMECSNASITSPRPRVDIECLDGFPFYPAPGCFEPNPFMLPDHFFPEPFDYNEHKDFYEWIASAKEWSGDAIELIEPCTTSARPESEHQDEKTAPNKENKNVRD